MKRTIRKLSTYDGRRVLLVSSSNSYNLEALMLRRKLSCPSATPSYSEINYTHLEKSPGLLEGRQTGRRKEHPSTIN